MHVWLSLQIEIPINSTITPLASLFFSLPLNINMHWLKIKKKKDIIDWCFVWVKVAAWMVVGTLFTSAHLFKGNLYWIHQLHVPLVKPTQQITNTADTSFPTIIDSFSSSNTTTLTRHLAFLPFFIYADSTRATPNVHFYGSDSRHCMRLIMSSFTSWVIPTTWTASLGSCP